MSFRTTLIAAALSSAAATVSPGFAQQSDTPVAAAPQPQPMQVTQQGYDLYQQILTQNLTGSGIDSFYRSRKYEPFWFKSGFFGSDLAALQTAVDAMGVAPKHGIPSFSSKMKVLAQQAQGAEDSQSRAAVDLEITKTFLEFGNAISAGVIEPRSASSEINVTRPFKPAAKILEAYAKAPRADFFDRLAPQTPEYQRLLKERARLGGGAAETPGPVVPAGLRPGMSGPAVQVLRDKLTALGFAGGQGESFDAGLVAVLKQFQTSKGLGADGIPGPATLRALNGGAAGNDSAQMRKILVNLERQRWLNFDRGARHIMVNLPDFTVQVVDNGRPVFSTRSVIGKSQEFQTPEFSDQMTHMVVNPTWHVPRSIAGKEYLPILQSDRGALKSRNMRLVNSAGNEVDPYGVDFSQYNASNFPYMIKQDPDPGNALGRVKFMFPNKWNIYLHDTPSKGLFNESVRAFSHGCVRLGDPFDFAYTLLARQSSNPQGQFKSWLDTGNEKYVNLQEPVPVHITYLTAWPQADGSIRYLNDIYGRDAQVYRALVNAGAPQS
ncbi:L,D-transpeptidase family protein [Paracoccaceae bacterium GXU_MW_L88]